MYSLDQVIYFLEQRQQTEDWNIRDAAIAYLKGYREILPEYAQMKLDAVNEPLTWEELKTMDMKPVFYEDISFGRKVWGIVIVQSEDIYLDWVIRCCDGSINGCRMGLRDDKQGEWWQAYRKERR